MLRVFRNPTVASLRFPRSRISATNSGPAIINCFPISELWLTCLVQATCLLYSAVATADVQRRSSRLYNLAVFDLEKSISGLKPKGRRAGYAATTANCILTVGHFSQELRHARIFSCISTFPRVKRVPHELPLDVRIRVLN